LKSFTTILEYGKIPWDYWRYNTLERVMTSEKFKSSWVAFVLFYVVLVAIITTLDWANSLLTLHYWGLQVGLVTLGVGIFAVVGVLTPELSAARGVLLTFTVGILTIIPAVLLGLGIANLWPQYFYIAFGMAAGSFLSFLFLRFSKRIPKEDQSEMESESIDRTA